jgi:hypothetical protein
MRTRNMIPRLPVKEQARFRRTVNRLYWRKGVMPYYWDCPHEYVIDEFYLYILDAPWGVSERTFNYLSRMIEKHGQPMPWRSRRDVSLFDGRYVYWRAECVINRTYRQSMLFAGYPPPPVLEKLRKRFWPTRTERAEYKRIKDAAC